MVWKIISGWNLWEEAGVEVRRVGKLRRKKYDIVSLSSWEECEWMYLFWECIVYGFLSFSLTHNFCYFQNISSFDSHWESGESQLISRLHSWASPRETGKNFSEDYKPLLETSLVNSTRRARLIKLIQVQIIFNLCWTNFTL